jgi:hypothetical protein
LFSLSLIVFEYRGDWTAIPGRAICLAAAPDGTVLCANRYQVWFLTMFADDGVLSLIFTFSEFIRWEPIIWFGHNYQEQWLGNIIVY